MLYDALSTNLRNIPYTIPNCKNAFLPPLVTSVPLPVVYKVHHHFFNSSTFHVYIQKGSYDKTIVM